MLTRRRFLTAFIPACALASVGLAAVGYRRGGCPLSNSGGCEGPCTALVDGNGDLLCDRIVLPAAQAEAPAAVEEQPTALSTATALPTLAPTAAGRPALAQPTATAPQPTPRPAKPTLVPARPKQPALPAASSRQAVACPFGLVNDRYPGRCGRYVDHNNDGICDLSEPTS